MREIREAELEAGRGIVDDRYHAAKGTFSEQLKGQPDSQITLIEAEQIDRFNLSTGMQLSYGELRRNIVTMNVDLNGLVGVRFRVGEVVLEGIRLCEPCAYLAKRVTKEVLPEMVHRAGLRARIVTGGKIKTGDAIQDRA